MYWNNWTNNWRTKSWHILHNMIIKVIIKTWTRKFKLMWYQSTKSENKINTVVVYEINMLWMKNVITIKKLKIVATDWSAFSSAFCTHHVLYKKPSLHHIISKIVRWYKFFDNLRKSKANVQNNYVNEFILCSENNNSAKMTCLVMGPFT